MTLRPVIGKVHLYLGLASCLLVAFVGLTGSLIVFEEELDRLIDPSFFEMRAPYGSEREPTPLSRAIELVEGVRPGLTVLRMHFRHMPGGPYVVTARDAGDPGTSSAEREFAVDPYAGEVIAERSAMHPVAVIWQLHIDLMMGETGRTILGISAILLTLSVISGVIVWWPKTGNWRQSLTIKKGAAPHRRNVDLHRVTGVYLFVPLFVAAITGVAIIWPQYVFPALEVFLEIPETERSEPREIDPTRDIGIDRAVVLAREHIPQGQLRMVHTPASFESLPYYIVSIRSFDNGHPRGRSYVYVYPDNGEIWYWEETRGNTLGYQIRWEWLLPAHSGDILGIPGKIAMLLAGLAPLLFTVTGIAIWRKKRRARLVHEARQPGEAIPEPAE